MAQAALQRVTDLMAALPQLVSRADDSTYVMKQLSSQIRALGALEEAYERYIAVFDETVTPAQELKAGMPWFRPHAQLNVVPMASEVCQQIGDLAVKFGLSNADRPEAAGLSQPEMDPYRRCMLIMMMSMGAVSVSRVFDGLWPEMDGLYGTLRASPDASASAVMDRLTQQLGDEGLMTAVVAALRGLRGGMRLAAEGAGSAVGVPVPGGGSTQAWVRAAYAELASTACKLCHFASVQVFRGVHGPLISGAKPMGELAGAEDMAARLQRSGLLAATCDALLAVQLPDPVGSPPSADKLKVVAAWMDPKLFDQRVYTIQRLNAGLVAASEALAQLRVALEVVQGAGQRAPRKAAQSITAGIFALLDRPEVVALQRALLERLIAHGGGCEAAGVGGGGGGDSKGSSGGGGGGASSSASAKGYGAGRGRKARSHRASSSSGGGTGAGASSSSGTSSSGSPLQAGAPPNAVGALLELELSLQDMVNTCYRWRPYSTEDLHVLTLWASLGAWHTWRGVQRGLTAGAARGPSPSPGSSLPPLADVAAYAARAAGTLRNLQQGRGLGGGYTHAASAVSFIAPAAAASAPASTLASLRRAAELRPAHVVLAARMPQLLRCFGPPEPAGQAGCSSEQLLACVPDWLEAGIQLVALAAEAAEGGQGAEAAVRGSFQQDACWFRAPSWYSPALDSLVALTDWLGASLAAPGLGLADLPPALRAACAARLSSRAAHRALDHALRLLMGAQHAQHAAVAQHTARVGMPDADGYRWSPVRCSAYPDTVVMQQPGEPMEGVLPVLCVAQRLLPLLPLPLPAAAPAGGEAGVAAGGSTAGAGAGAAQRAAAGADNAAGARAPSPSGQAGGAASAAAAAAAGEEQGQGQGQDAQGLGPAVTLSKLARHAAAALEALPVPLTLPAPAAAAAHIGSSEHAPTEAQRVGRRHAWLAAVHNGSDALGALCGALDAVTAAVRATRGSFGAVPGPHAVQGAAGGQSDAGKAPPEVSCVHEALAQALASGCDLAAQLLHHLAADMAAEGENGSGGAGGAGQLVGGGGLAGARLSEGVRHLAAARCGGVLDAVQEAVRHGLLPWTHVLAAQPQRLLAAVGEVLKADALAVGGWSARGPSGGVAKRPAGGPRWGAGAGGGAGAGWSGGVVGGPAGAAGRPSSQMRELLQRARGVGPQRVVLALELVKTLEVMMRHPQLAVVLRAWLAPEVVRDLALGGGGAEGGGAEGGSAAGGGTGEGAGTALAASGDGGSGREAAGVAGAGASGSKPDTARPAAAAPAAAAAAGNAAAAAAAVEHAGALLGAHGTGKDRGAASAGGGGSGDGDGGGGSGDGDGGGGSGDGAGGGGSGDGAGGSSDGASGSSDGGRAAAEGGPTGGLPYGFIGPGSAAPSTSVPSAACIFDDLLRWVLLDCSEVHGSSLQGYVTAAGRRDADWSVSDRVCHYGVPIEVSHCVVAAQMAEQMVRRCSFVEPEQRPELGPGSVLWGAGALPPPVACAPPVALQHLRLCGNPRCGSWGGASEAGLKLQQCAGCRAVRYCGRECQVQHWREGHKAECPVLKAAAQQG